MAEDTDEPQRRPGAVVRDSPAALHGEPAATRLLEALAAVGQLVPYLRAEVGAVPTVARGAPAPGGEEQGASWVSASDLVSDPDWLAGVVQATSTVLDTDDQVVAGSIFVQGYAYRLLAMALSCATVDGVLPGSDPRSTALLLRRGRPSAVAYTVPTALEVGSCAAVTGGAGHDIDALARLVLDDVVDGHLRLLVDALRRRRRIGLRLLWGNIAASAAAALRTMEGCLGPWVVPLGERLFDLAPAELQGLGRFVVIERSGRRGWFWERATCCLYDRLPGDIRCADCSRTPTLQRRAAYIASLER